MQRTIAFAFLLHLALCLNLTAANRPNVVVIFVDDMGFSDLGCYGSEIDTPNLDQLAANGARFTQFYNTAKCHSSRVSLLTGRYCRQAGDEPMKRAVTLPEMLGKAGYSTLMSGKWHLAKQPTDYGFDRYFGHLSGATHYYKGDSTFRLDGQKYDVPQEGFYTTIADVDYAIDFLDDARKVDDKPWFLYLAFNAPHAPLHPLKPDYEKYVGQYDVGWDVINQRRFEKQRELSLLPEGAALSDRPEPIKAWDDLSDAFKDWETRRMTALAGMIDRVDQEVGRLIANLKDNGEYDNTLLVFASDNGACPYDRTSTGRKKPPYDPSSYWSDSTGWAWARNTPFKYFKQNQFEGGVMSPTIVHWPAGLKQKPGSIVRSPAHLVDIYPTLAEVCEAEIPMEWPDREPTPLAGTSLQPILDGGEMSERPPIHLLFNQDRGLRDGDWKLVSFKSQAWELYNLAADRTETNNVADQHPDIVERMSALWHDMAENVLMTPKKERHPVKSGPVEHVNKEWTIYTHPSASTERHQAGRKKRKK